VELIDLSFHSSREWASIPWWLHFSVQRWFLWLSPRSQVNHCAGERPLIRLTIVRCRNYRSSWSFSRFKKTTSKTSRRTWRRNTCMPRRRWSVSRAFLLSLVSSLKLSIRTTALWDQPQVQALRWWAYYIFTKSYSFNPWHSPRAQVLWFYITIRLFLLIDQVICPCSVVCIFFHFILHYIIYITTRAVCNASLPAPAAGILERWQVWVSETLAEICSQCKYQCCGCIITLDEYYSKSSNVTTHWH